MYPILTRATGAGGSPGSGAHDFTLSAESAATQVREQRPDIVFLCAPNNPTGTPLRLDVIEAVYDAFEGFVIVDEAYEEFAPRDEPSAISLLPGRPRLVVSRTMSKAFAFAGARVGYLAADPAFVDALRLVRLPYHLSALTQAPRRPLSGTPTPCFRWSTRSSRSATASRRPCRAGYTAHESWTNFVLFGGVDDPAATWKALYDRGVLIRDVGIPHHLRVSAGTADETTAFLDALASIGSRA